MSHPEIYHNQQLCSWPLSGAEIDQNSAMGSLFEEIQERFNSAREIITEIRIDGVVVSPLVQEKLGSMPRSQFARVDIFCKSRADVIEETLSMLSEFAVNLRQLSLEQKSFDRISELDPVLIKMVEGFHLILETLATIRGMLSTPSSESLQLWDADIRSLLSDLLDMRENSSATKELQQSMQEMFSEHIPDNLSHLMRAVLPDLLYQSRALKNCG